jgi:hypothetical protein
MFQLIPSDFTELSAFPLNWRWKIADGFSQPELANIKPLRTERASTLYAIATRINAGAEPLSVSAETSDDEQIRSWLLTLDASREDQTLLWWDKDTAVAIPWGLFVDRWTDFCYPSSDDVTIVPGTGRWRIEFWHWESFDLYQA